MTFETAEDAQKILHDASVCVCENRSDMSYIEAIMPNAVNVNMLQFKLEIFIFTYLFRIYHVYSGINIT